MNDIDRTEPYGDDHDAVRAACEAEQHPAWTTTGDSFHGVCGVCACGDRLYALDGGELP